MPKLVIGQEEFELNEEGFMLAPARWNEAIAITLAKETEGLNLLTDDHWKVINYIRQYYLQYSQAPMIRKLCKETGISLKQVYILFPSGPAKGACKIAGLPKPSGCV